MSTEGTAHENEPRGFGEHRRGLAGEYAHEQGWGLDEDERRKVATGPHDTSGGRDYEYGARDFGDEPVNTERFGGTEAEGAQGMAAAAGQDAKINNSQATTSRTGGSRETGTASGGTPHDGEENYGVQSGTTGQPNTESGGGATRQSPEGANSTPKSTPGKEA